MNQTQNLLQGKWSRKWSAPETVKCSCEEELCCATCRAFIPAVLCGRGFSERWWMLRPLMIRNCCDSWCGGGADRRKYSKCLCFLRSDISVNQRFLEVIYEIFVWSSWTEHEGIAEQLMRVILSWSFMGMKVTKAVRFLIWELSTTDGIH